jgi:hypothetical protein
MQSKSQAGSFATDLALGGYTMKDKYRKQQRGNLIAYPVKKIQAA